MSTSRSGRPAQMRPSRAEREPYTDALAQAVAEGRLTDALYEERVDEVERASTFGRLDELVADIPFTPAVPERTYARLRTGRVVLTGLSWDSSPEWSRTWSWPSLLPPRPAPPL